MGKYCLKTKQITKIRDRLDKSFAKNKKKKIWRDINSLVADAYCRGKK